MTKRWDLATGAPVGDPLTGHTGTVNAVGDLAGRPVVVSAGSDETVRVWDLASGAPVGEPLTGHTRVVVAVAVGDLAGRPVVVSAGSDGTVRVGPGDGSQLRAITLGFPARDVSVCGCLSCRDRRWTDGDHALVGTWRVTLEGPSLGSERLAKGLHNLTMPGGPNV